MEASEYLAFIPLLIFGIGLADLLSEWKRLFDPEQWYLPYSLFTILFTELAVYNIFIYINLVEQLPGQSYLTYLSFLLQPFLFLLTVNAFTPDKNSDTKEYFISRLPAICFLFAMFIASHFLYTSSESIYIIISRVLAIIILLSIGFTRKIWLIYVISLVWLISFLFRANMVSTSTDTSRNERQLNEKIQQHRLKHHTRLQQFQFHHYFPSQKAQDFLF